MGFSYLFMQLKEGKPNANPQQPQGEKQTWESRDGNAK